MTATSPRPTETQRAQLLKRLEEDGVWDLMVIGGGATGLGVALDASLRGLTVVLVDSHDFASGTSSRSTKLLHGGVRYLGQGNIKLVREALAERAGVLAMAPHLAQALPFVLPAFRWWELPFYGAGLKLYEWMSGQKSLGPTEWLGRHAVAAALPGLRTQGLCGGIRYWDAQFDDARLAVEVAKAAQSHGALVLNYMKVTALASPKGGCRGINLEDQLTGQGYKVQARCVINATGVWVDEIRRLDLAGSDPVSGLVRSFQRLVSPSQGVHVVVDRALFPSDHALLVPKTKDGRVLFAVPWLGAVILGTTDTARNDTPREPAALEEELDFILREASEMLARPVTRSDIRSQWVGLRPLVNPDVVTGGSQSGTGITGNLSREHTILVSDAGLVTITGGKWTTFRVMASDALNRCMTQGLLPRLAAPEPGAFKLPTGGADKHTGLAADPVSALAKAASNVDGNRDTRTDRELGFGLTESMVRHAARCEYAHTVEDVLARRTRLLFVDAAAACAVAKAVSNILEQETGCSSHLAIFEQLAAQYLGQVPHTLSSKKVIDTQKIGMA